MLVELQLECFKSLFSISCGKCCLSSRVWGGNQDSWILPAALCALWSWSDSWRRHSLNLQQEVTCGFDCIILSIGIFKEGSQVLKSIIHISERSKMWEGRCSLEQCVTVVGFFCIFCLSKLRCFTQQMCWLRHSGSHNGNLEVVTCPCYKCGKAAGVLAVVLGQIKVQLLSCE